MGKTKGRANGDGDVYPRKNTAGKVTSYRGAYVGPDGKRRYVSGRTKTEARDALARARSDASGGVVFDAGSLTVGDYLDRWFRDAVAGSVKETTYSSYERLLRVNVTPIIGRVKLKSLTQAHLSALYRDRLDAGLSPRTVQYIHVVLHRALKQAVRWSLVPRNVSEAVDPPKVYREEMRPLSTQQAKAFLKAAAGHRLEALYIVALRCGLRQGELLALTWEDVDLEAGVLRVQRTLSKVKDSKPVYTSPKTKKSRRRIKLSVKTVEALKAHRKGQTEERLKLGSLWTDHDLVFTTEVGSPINRHNLKNRTFKRFLAAAGLPQDFRFHDLRHTCATILLSQGQHPKFVQELLGHSSITTTLDTYSHVLPGMDDGLADAMDEAL